MQKSPPGTSCKCVSLRVNNESVIEYCPLHEAAPTLLEALKDLLAWANIQDYHSAQAVSIRGRAWTAIAATEGRKGKPDDS